MHKFMQAAVFSFLFCGPPLPVPWIYGCIRHWRSYSCNDSIGRFLWKGADYVEMDVQLTKDNRVIVYHDYEAVIISKKVSGFSLRWKSIIVF